jgi:hypothetical protein
MSPKPALPPWITYFNVLLPAGQGQRHNGSSWSTRSTGQVATRCHHPDCCPGGDSAGHLIGVDLVMTLAVRRAWAHSKRHQPPDQAS